MACLLVCSALVSGSETAFFSLSPQNVNSLRESNSRSGSAALKLLSMQDELLATILIVNNLVNICIVMLLNAVINTTMVFGGELIEFLFKVVFVTFMLLLFGEIMPKIFASYNALRVVNIMSSPLLVFKRLFNPFSFILIKVGNNIAKHKKSNISIDQLSDAIEITSDQSVEEKKMLSGIIHFVNTEVEAIMKSRLDIVAIDIESDISELRRTIIESGFSRIPVYEDNIDNIKGILYVKDMLPFLFDESKTDWAKLIRKVYFIPERKKINDLLEEFQDAKVHMAIVVDEYGSTLGLVSLEDILEEIVGEISDESDNEHKFYIKIDANTYIFEGKTHISDVIKVLELDEDYFAEVGNNADTIAGVMLEIKRDFLKQGEMIKFENLELTVSKKEGYRIDSVKVVVK
ncbi:MAG: hemolysin family protein [Rikenellaceae bacterium]